MLGAKIITRKFARTSDEDILKYISKMATESKEAWGCSLLESVSYTHLDVYKRQVYRIADKVENDFPYVVDDETIYRYQKGIGDDLSLIHI